MEWKKSNISQSELEKQQQAYIKEALEMEIGRAHV